MNNSWFRSAFAVGAALCIALHADAQQTPSGVVDASAQQSVEAAIRKAAEDFTGAFERDDARGIAMLFTDDGVYVDGSGQRLVGRESIQKEYEKLFEQNPDSRLHIEIDSIRLVNSTTAIEEGRLAVMPQPPGPNRVMGNYTAVHSLQDNQWLVAHVAETRVELPPDAGDLQDLDWMTGTWVAASESTIVEAKFRWIESGQYLARTHTVTEAKEVTSTALQIIGVDPSTGRITSWSFTSDGGRAVGVWSPSPDGWSIQSTGVLNDGTPTSAINLLSRKDENTVAWRSVGRMVGDASLPDAADVTLKRQ